LPWRRHPALEPVRVVAAPAPPDPLRIDEARHHPALLELLHDLLDDPRATRAGRPFDRDEARRIARPARDHLVEVDPAIGPARRDRPELPRSPALVPTRIDRAEPSDHVFGVLRPTGRIGMQQPQ